MIRATIVINSPIRLFNFQTLAKNLTLSLYKPYFLYPNLRIFRHRNFTTMVTVSENQSPPSVTTPPVVILTEKEKLIFNRLLKVVNHFNLNTQLRVAGGWVRDKLRVAGGWVRGKLLGKDCIDIDIALDNMMGQKFCEKVNEYLTSTGEETHGIGVIQCNPDQSKHLETARMRLFDLWIDFVNLRSEDYCENSRIPTMRFGTAEEDAYRRDLTINSLFYNINTSSVEDFTGKGLADLRSGKIVTPLPPKETFLDDPLRVLRAIRFGARFEFTLDDELKRAACDEEVRSAIAGKISRERIGHEVDLMISGNQPVKAIEYISNLKLFPVVFSLPPEVDPCISAEFDKSCVAYMDATWSLMQLLGSSNFTDEQKRLGLYSTLFLPLRGTTYRDNKAKKVPAVDYIFRSSLKLKASDAETVINVHNATRKFMLHIPSILSEKAELETAAAKEVNGVPDVPFAQRLRVKTGLILREIKEFWQVALLASVLLYPSEIKLTDLSCEQLEMELRIDTFKTVEREILDLGLEKVWEIKPLVNGKEIMNVLQLKTGGPLVKDWQRKLLEWQLVHPSGTSEECLDWMRQTHSKEPKRARPE